MALTVLDAGVVIALLDADDDHHAAAKDALRACRDRADDLVLPASAYAEVLVAPYRTDPTAVEKVDSFVDALPARIEPVTRSVAARAAQLRAEHQAVRLPDALVIATALTVKADLLLTTDRGWPAVGVQVQIVGA